MWAIIKNAIGDFWDEMFWLVIFNILWLICLVLIIPYPLATFGLFFIAHDVGEGKGIKFSQFFGYGLKWWRQAYLWGIINLVVLTIMWINFTFYATVEAEWAVFAQMFMLVLMVLWVLLQLIALAFYPRLVNPNYKLALRNAGVAISRYPLLALLLIVILIVMGVLTFFVPAIIVIGAAAIIALITNRIVAAIVKKEQPSVEG